MFENLESTEFVTKIKLTPKEQLKLEVVDIFLKNCQVEIMIDQNGLKIYEEIMKCSYLENFEAFSLQFYY